jgi:hypothetical protein
MTGGGRDRKGGARGGFGRVIRGGGGGRVVSLGNSVICTGDPPRLHSLIKHIPHCRTLYT